MCGIIGYTGSEDVKGVLLDALELLEYRGYDSAGIAVADTGLKQTKVYKCAGRVKDLRAICESEKLITECGIGHTRWATHGGVNDTNAHPHQVGKVTLVHNGIIENYRELIADYELESVLKSETDSEVVAALLNKFYTGDPDEAIKKTVSKLKGTFALVILFEDHQGEIYSVRNVSPIVATLCKEGAMLASDLTALCRFTNRYFVVPEYHILKLAKDAIVLKDFNGNQVEPDYLEVDWELNNAGKNGYPFYMEKEIMEQPDAIERTITNRITSGMPDFTADGVPDEIFTQCERVNIIACGTAMHAGLVAQALIKSILHMHIDVDMASEFMYSDPVIDEKSLVIAVSQSGETIDTLEAGTVAGYASLSRYRERKAFDPAVEISIYIHAGYRGRGIGRSLMEKTLQYAKECPQIGTVVSLITSENEVSIRLHERFGFSYCGQIRQAGVKFGRKLGLNAYQIIYDREIE